MGMFSEEIWLSDADSLHNEAMWKKSLKTQTWRTKDGDRIMIPHLSDSHLENIIKWIRRETPHLGGYRKPLLDMLTTEVTLRNANPKDLKQSIENATIQLHFKEDTVRITLKRLMEILNS